MSANGQTRDGARLRFWRSLEEQAGSPELVERARLEFPERADLLDDPAGRREFLRLMGASLALAGASACTRQPREEIVPYSVPPEEIVPGRPLFFATALTLDGLAQGILVESHMGRPTKVEGNPSHPLSLGATDVFAQAAILDLYDPDRSRTPRLGGAPQSWTAAMEALRAIARDQRAKKGGGLRILTGTLTSPTLAALLRETLAQMPEARWHQYSSANRDNVRLGGRIALGRFVETQWRIAAADVIVSLDSDFLTRGPAHLLHAREFAERRKPDLSRLAMNRLYALESTPTLTGAAADHRLALRPSEIEPFARAVAARLGLPVGTPAAFGPGSSHARWVEVVAKDLRTHAGASLVIVGEAQPASLHALGHALNHHLANAGRTLGYTESVEAEPTEQIESLRELVRDMASGHVQTLLILDGNPVYSAPADLAFGRRLEKVPLSVHLGPYEDETAALCRWHLPQAHELEAWGDARAADGTVTVQQPLIAPLYDGRSPIEVLTILAGGPERSARDVVRDYWRSQRNGVDFERFWRRTLHDGVMEGTTLAPCDAPLQPGDWARSAARASEARGIDAVFRADACVHDGRFANNAWLQELPRPLTKLTWDNAVLLGPATARELDIASGDVVRLTLRARSARGPACIVPGHAEGVVTLPLGYGRTRSGRVGTEVGFDAGILRASDGLWFGSGLIIAKTGETQRLACTQDHWSMEGREIIRVTAPGDEAHHERAGSAKTPAPDTPPSLYPPWRDEGHAWGMAIDLSACTGCNACVVACQSENNIPVVGRAQVARGREMHWIRVDRYYEGPPENPRAYHQPVPCMQCENAPCEPVCPVAATSHSDEGLNDQVYNRCVGTRYCSNNCPYKVRRFNFLLYQDWNTPSLSAMRNPDVTVRSRGVMEKCTYCVQRINQARIAAKNEGREMRDGDVRTACQAVCPSQAISFGDVNRPNSAVSLWKAQARNYGLLAELGTRPRTTYLAVLRNPNPELAAPPEREG